MRFIQFLEEAFGHPDQKAMDKVLKSNGWAPAKRSDYKENLSLKGEHYTDKAKAFKEVGVKQIDSMIDFAKQLKHYVHPDKPHESIETSPGSSVYNTWKHSRGIPAGKQKNDYQFLGGKRGKSGKASDLEKHLTSGAKIK